MAELNIIKASPLTTYGVIAGIAGLCALSVSAVVSPGCTGPESDLPCDYAAKFKTSAKRFRGHSPHFAIEVLDLGSSVYVRQTAPENSGFVLHTPGALIDKKSCRVCQADGYATVGDDEGLPILKRYPAERPMTRDIGMFGY